MCKALIIGAGGVGTVVTQKIYGDFAAKEIEKTKAMTDSLDNMISWRKDDSDVAKLNSGEVLENAYLTETIKRCSEISALSEGVFDVTVGGVSQLWSIGTMPGIIKGSMAVKSKILPRKLLERFAHQAARNPAATARTVAIREYSILFTILGATSLSERAFWKWIRE